jgi:hypothetical protein
MYARLVNAAEGELPFYRLLLRYTQSNIDILQGKHSQIPASLHQLIRNPSLEKDRIITQNSVWWQKRVKRGREGGMNCSDFHRDSAYIGSPIITTINRGTVYSLIEHLIAFDI